MHHNGFTLIELLITIAAALLGISMMLTLFKQHALISYQSRQDAEFDSQLQSGLLIAQKYIQNAGYGSGSVADISVGEFEGQQAIFWRYIRHINSGVHHYECQGLTEKISTDASLNTHRLVLLHNQDCQPEYNIQSGKWQEQQSIVALHTTMPTPLFHYQITQAPCMPYGIELQDTTAPGVQHLTLIAVRPHASGSARKLRNVVCLNNIKSL